MAKHNEGAKRQQSNTGEVPATIQAQESEIKANTASHDDGYAKDKTAIDRELAEYTRQLADYTRELANYTYFLVGATVVLGLVGAWQGLLLRKSVGLAREDFVATHRPKVILRDVRFVRYSENDSDDALLRYRVVNIGSNDAVLVKIDFGMGETRITENPVPPERNLGRARQVSAAAIKPGEFFEDTFRTEFSQIGVLSYPDQVTVRVWFIGTITYSDRIGTERSTAFCCYFDPTTCRFRSLKGDEITAYEYQD